MNIELPTAFSDRIKSKLGDSHKAFLQSLQSSSPVSIRWNKMKKPEEQTIADPVLWCPYGEYLSERPVFTIDPLFHSGIYYPQEASSMVLWSVLDKLHIEKENLKILDLCAAPGGKSTLLSDYFDQDDIIVCNEVIKARSNILAENVMKWSRPNMIVTNNDPRDFSKAGLTFDLIVVDAPCSGEGMFRKDPAAINEWSEQNVQLCAARQNRIIQDILPCLNPGGYIIYSTCTYNDEENLDNISLWSGIEGIKSVKIDFPQEWGITETSDGKSYGYHFYPHLVRGEGFFVSVLRSDGDLNDIPSAKNSAAKSQLTKNEAAKIFQWVIINAENTLIKSNDGTVELLSQPAANDIEVYKKRLRVISSGINCGKLNRDVFIPSHGLALSNFTHSQVPDCDLDLKSALLYLSKEHFDLPADLAQGWIRLTYQSSGIGWIKNLGNRFNNYLPNELKIRNKSLFEHIL
jgi:16S rRNA C967 or C1407 C5-methylase (RsmB/RsmF family)/NOL1/NOP2/fmu family ribosome biogenesis protein